MFDERELRYLLLNRKLDKIEPRHLIDRVLPSGSH
jgi:hypothetical protein